MSSNNVINNLYIIKYLENEKSLCFMEMKYIFQKIVARKCFFSVKEINPSISPYIKHHISILYCENTFEKLLNVIIINKLKYDKYRFFYFRFDDQEVVHSEWTKKIIQLSTEIDGIVEMENPQVILGFTKVDDTWIIGEYQTNDNLWKYHDKKPNTNSHSLGIRTARALVNIASNGKQGCNIIDPCCGVGTVIIEAMSLQQNIKGYEILKNIAIKAQDNLAFFGIKNVIKNCDMHTTSEIFDVGIIDIPYGIFTPITKEEQKDIIKTARRITKKAVIITFEDMTDIIEGVGFNVIDFCQVIKGKFIRYISICN